MNKSELKQIAAIVFAVLAAYILVSWMRFAIVHPKAGDGAFFVHFPTVIMWGEVPELQEAGVAHE